MGVRSRIRRQISVILASCLSLADIRRVLQYKLNSKKGFLFNLHRLEYFFHSYNNFGLTERSVEIPIVRHYLEQGHYQNVLEIGNVTNYYYEYFRQAFLGKRKTVVDKYELASDVVNVDIAKYAPGVQFDFIFSISTFEHMDSDRGRNPDYVEGSSELMSIAADNLRRVSDVLLLDGGKFVITAPLGYAVEWDATFYSRTFEECDVSRFRRHVLRKKKESVWEQVEVTEGKHAVYNHPLPGANYLSVVEFDK